MPEEYKSICRDRFEQWISSPPYERSIARYPDDPSRYAWPGNYKEIEIDLAWNSWVASWKVANKP
jgi:hypothetical protein